MKRLISWFALIVTIFCGYVVVATAGDLTLTQDGKVPGQPFQDLQRQVDELTQQIEDIQQIPAPPGPPGPPGTGKNIKVIDAEGKEIGILLEASQNWVVVYDTYFKLRMFYYWLPPPQGVVFTSDAGFDQNNITNILSYLEPNCTGEIYSNDAAWFSIGLLLFRRDSGSPNELYYRDEELPTLVDATYQSTHESNNGCVTQSGTSEWLAPIKQLTDNLIIDPLIHEYVVPSYIPPLKIVEQ